MHCYWICKLQLIKIIKAVFDISSIFKSYCHAFIKWYYLHNYPCVSVKHSASLFYSHSTIIFFRPVKLIVIFYLHNLIAFPENIIPMLFFHLGGTGRIEEILKNIVKSFNTYCWFSWRCKHLYFVYICTDIAWQLILNNCFQCSYYGLRTLSVYKKKILAILV